MMDRRDFLRRGATVAAAAGLGSVLTTGTATAVESEDKPDHVTLEYDEEWLRTYRPAFLMDYETRQRSNAVYAYKATSEEYEYDWACYWHRMSHQDGASLIGVDAHLYDHEPVYVAVDGDGDAERAVYTYYHHFASQVEQPALQDLLIDSEETRETHIALEIIDPWHHYNAAPNTEISDLTLDYEFEDWTAAVDTWEDRGVFEATSGSAVYDPASMWERDSWWDESTTDYRFASLWHGLAHRFDWSFLGGDPTTYP